MYDAGVQQIAHCVVRQNISAQVHHSDVCGQSGFQVRVARSTVLQPALLSWWNHVSGEMWRCCPSDVFFLQRGHSVSPFVARIISHATTD